MLAIYKRELRSYFQSMIGCVFVAFLVLFTGIYFTAYNLTAGYPYFSYTLSGSLIVFIVGIPLITMRSFSEERKNKTDQLLLTAPVSLTKVVLGKYFAMATVVAVPNLIFCLFPLIIKMNGTAYLKVDYISIGVFFLLGCVYLAIGMFLSTLTESQIIALSVHLGAAAFVSVERDRQLPAVFGVRLYGRAFAHFERHHPLYLANDAELGFERHPGSGMRDRVRHCVLCEARPV